MIRTRGLHKRYGRSVALDHLDLNVPHGAVYGFIGENGAGKTTTIRILATLMQPGGGEAVIGDYEVTRKPDDARRILGYVPDFFGVYDDLKTGEYLDFYASLYGIRRADVPALRDNLLELVNLGNKRDVYVETLSRGMQQRLCLARALLHDPQVLLLDEQASGLDPIARVEFRELLRELSRMDKTILVSSHILTELADLCTHVGMLASGRIVIEGTVAEVLAGEERPAYVLRVLRDPEQAAQILERSEAVTGIAVLDDAVSFRTDPGAESAAQALAAVVAAGIPVSYFAETKQDLESTFMRLAQEASVAQEVGARS
jgi:ABC-2 type transport system ATP-binding protein